MQLINTDGMVVIGPGSEWFWTALTGIVLGLTGFGIFRQLSAQRFGNELAYWRSLNDEWMSDRMKRLRITTLIELAQHRPDLSYAMLEVGGVFEELAYLQNHGLMESEMNLDPGSVTVQRYWWGMAAPRIAKEREDNPRLWREFERLAMRMAERDRRAGIADDRLLDPEYLYGPLLDKAIAGQLEGLRIEQEIRSGCSLPGRCRNRRRSRRAQPRLVLVGQTVAARLIREDGERLADPAYTLRHGPKPRTTADSPRGDLAPAGGDRGAAAGHV